MLFINKKKMSTSEQFEKQKKELAYNIKVAIGYHRSIDEFARLMRMTDSKPIINLLKRNYNELPDRQLLRRIANRSQGRITYRNLYEICGYSEHDPEEDRSWAKWVPKRSEIYMVDLGMYGLDCEQQGERPFCVVSNNKGNTHGSIVVGVPLTTKFKNPILHIPIGVEYGMRVQSYAMVEHIRSISKRRFFYNGGIPHKITTLPDHKMQQIQHALEFELGFQPLMFDENEAFRMIEHIRTLQENVKLKKSHNLVDILNQKVDELISYCSKYHKNHKFIIAEYDRLNNYAYEAI